MHTHTHTHTNTYKVSLVIMFVKKESQTLACSSFSNVRICCFVCESKLNIFGFWTVGQANKQFEDVNLGFRKSALLYILDIIL